MKKQNRIIAIGFRNNNDKMLKLSLILICYTLKEKENRIFIYNFKITYILNLIFKRMY